MGLSSPPLLLRIRLPCFQHRLLSVNNRIYMVDKCGVGSFTVYHRQGINQLHQRAIGIVSRLSDFFHDTYLAGGCFFRPLRYGGEESGFAGFQICQPGIEGKGSKFAAVDGFQVLQKIVQDTVFFRLRERGRVAILVKQRFGFDGGLAHLVGGVGSHGFQEVVCPAPGIVAGGVCFGGDGGGGGRSLSGHCRRC